MRIGLLTTSYPRDPSDGAGSFVREFARTLVASGHTVEVLAPEPARRVRGVHDPGISVTHVRYLWPRALQNTFYGAGVPDNLRRDPRAWLGPVPFTLALGRRAREASARWDAIVSHWAVPCAWIAADVRGDRPHLAVLHSADIHALTRLPMRAALARRIVRGASGLWFVTEAHRKRFVELLPRVERDGVRARSWTGPMGVPLPETASDPHAREHARRTLGLTRFSVLMLGRLVSIKGADVLLRASAGRPWNVLVAGDGPERARLTAQARALGVDARFFGHVAGRDKQLLLTAADAFVVPSRVLPSGRSEGLPVAMLEAMAHGLPIVASAVGGIAEILPSSALVPHDCPDRLAEALDQLRRDPPRALEAGMNARRIAEHHRWSRAIEPALDVLSGRQRQLDFAPTP